MEEENQETQEEVQETEKKGKKKNPWMYSTVAMVVVLFIVAFAVGASPTAMVTDGGALSAQDAADKAVDYINNNLVQIPGDVSLVSVEDLGEIYRVTTSYQDQQPIVYITKDGLYLFLSQPADTSEEITTTTTTVPGSAKADRPEAYAFIMSYCPYGLQFLKAYVPVIELLGDKADVEVNFVHYLMHGEQEMNENTRMYCIQKEQNDKFTDYLRCFVESGNSASCIDSVGIDSDALDSCIASTDEQFQITKSFEESTSSYPPYLVDAVLAQQYSVRGSPTFVVNGQTMSVTRSAEAIKQVICASFNDPPEECNQVLSANTEAPSFGPIGSGSGSSSSGQC